MTLTFSFSIIAGLVGRQRSQFLPFSPHNVFQIVWQEVLPRFLRLWSGCGRDRSDGRFGLVAFVVLNVHIIIRNKVIVIYHLVQKSTFLEAVIVHLCDSNSATRIRRLQSSLVATFTPLTAVIRSKFLSPGNTNNYNHEFINIISGHSANQRIFITTQRGRFSNQLVQKYLTLTSFWMYLPLPSICLDNII